MALIVVRKEHALTHEKVKEKADILISRLTERYAIKSHWSGDTLKFERAGAKGFIELEKNQIMVQLKLGLLLAPMSGVIRQEIEQTLDKHLGVL